METMTITEALAEVKLTEKKIEKKKDNIAKNLFRFEHTPDPYSKDGGSQDVMKRELQAIQDLEIRLINIRGAIAQANITTKLTIGEVTRSLYDWITWKREIAEKRIKTFNEFGSAIKRKIDAEAANPTVLKDGEGKLQFAKLVLNLDYAELQSRFEKEGSLQETLDGKLSLKNATTTISF